jgi:serine/threonine protein kinase
VPLHIARPVGDIGYFRSAYAALRKLHAAGFTHNDLAKEQNWLRGADGRAYLTDFQLSTRLRGRAFRVAAYEDLRHYLKHKRSYAPEMLTAAEKRILARKSWLTLLWMATGKTVYIWVTRGLFRFTDREGGGPRLVNDAP